MSSILASPSKGSVLALATLALGGIVGARYLKTRKVSAAERLADALLDTEPLREASRDMADRPEARLAACATYLVDVCNGSSEGWGIGTGANDPIGSWRPSCMVSGSRFSVAWNERSDPIHARGRPRQ